MQVEQALELVGRAGARLRRLAPSPSIYWPGGVVSFSFDDFPRSALEVGGPILEAHRVRGTYYVAMGLAGARGDLGPLFELDDLRAAQARGHEIGCHTFEHLNCASAEGDALLSDVGQSAAGLGRLFEGFVPSSFAYPFGAVSPAAKRLLRRRFETCRGTQPGFNHRQIDVGELRANKIYAHTFDTETMRVLIDHNRTTGGWLIFYTHDVCDRPSAYGCRPDQLAETVRYAAGRSTILPIGDVAAYVRQGW
jgi:peptidoglycan/xylan/chitin deacetylase (PgdA/CDA1 family)